MIPVFYSSLGLLHCCILLSSRTKSVFSGVKHSSSRVWPCGRSQVLSQSTYTEQAAGQAAGRWNPAGDSSVESPVCYEPVCYEKEVVMDLKKLSRKALLLVFSSVLLFSVTQKSNAQTICSNQTGKIGRASCRERR